MIPQNSFHLRIKFPRFDVTLKKEEIIKYEKTFT